MTIRKSPSLESNVEPERLGIILLNWRDTHRTMIAADNLRSFEKIRPDIWIVDNQCDAKSRSILSAFAKDENLLFNEENLGFAGGNNVGIHAALNAGCTRILLLNTDVKIEESAVHSLLNALDDHPELGIVGPVLVEQENGLLRYHTGGRDIIRHDQTRISTDLLPEAGTGPDLADVDYVPGTVLLVRSKVLETIGLLDEDYFFSGEAADLCRRAQDAGFRVQILMRCTADHHRERNAGKRRETLDLYYNLRNRFLFIRRHQKSGRFFQTFRWALKGIALAGASLASGRMFRAKASGLAAWHGLTGKFGNRNDRFEY